MNMKMGKNRLLAFVLAASIGATMLAPMTTFADGGARDSGAQDSGEAVQASRLAASNSVTPPPEGYTTDENGIMAYRYTNNKLDIQGVFDNKWKMTTYDNRGFSTFIKNGEGAPIEVPVTGAREKVSNIPGLTVKVGVRFKSEGKVLKVTYLVANGGEAAVTYSLGSAADVQIGADDWAKITRFGKGFKMVSNNSDDINANDEHAQFNFFGRNANGVMDVSDFWYGDLMSRSVMAFAKEADIEEGSYDAGMGYSWKDKTIEPGDIQVYSVLIGIGGPGSETADEGIGKEYVLKVKQSYAENNGTDAYEEGEAVTIDCGEREGYTFDGWSSPDMTIPNAKSETVSFDMPAKPVTVTAAWKQVEPPVPDPPVPDPPVPPVPPTPSSGSGNSVSSLTFDPDWATDNVNTGKTDVLAEQAAADAAAALKENKSFLWVRNGHDISPEAFKAVYGVSKTLPIYADTTKNGVIQVRLYLNPALGKDLKEKILLGGTIGSSETRERFEKYFDNNMVLVSLGQNGTFGMPVEVAARVNLDGLDTNSLHFYSYNRETNKYYPIKTAYRIDANGFLHFTTILAGDIIITDKPITEKK